MKIMTVSDFESELKKLVNRFEEQHSCTVEKVTIRDDEDFVPYSCDNPRKKHVEITTYKK